MLRRLFVIGLLIGAAAVGGASGMRSGRWTQDLRRRDKNGRTQARPGEVRGLSYRSGRFGLGRRQQDLKRAPGRNSGRRGLGLSHGSRLDLAARHRARGRGPNAQTFSDSLSCRLLGRLDCYACGIAPASITVEGDFLYAGNDGQGWFLVFDVSDTLKPRLVSRLRLNADCIWSLVKTGDYILAAGDDGSDPRNLFAIIDVHDPVNPVLAGSLADSGYGVYQVATQGNYAYVAGDYSLDIIDISNPQSPVRVGRQALDCPNSVCVSGDFAYVVEDCSYLAIVDVSSPQQPRRRGELTLPDCADDAAVTGNCVIVPTWSSVEIIDASNPDDPYEMGFLETEVPFYSIQLDQDRAYLCGDAFGLVDISNPGQPTLLGVDWDVSMCELDHTLSVKGSKAYVFDIGDCWVLDCSDLGPPIVATWNPDLDACGVQVRDSLAYVTSTVGEFWIVNVADPRAPRGIGRALLPDGAWDVLVQDSLAYVSAGTSVRIINVAQPESPLEVGHYEAGAPTADLALRDSILYVACWDQGLRIVNVGNPAHPIEVGRVSNLNYAWGVAVQDSYAFVGADDGFAVVDIKNPAHPTVVSLNDSVAAAGVALEGHLAYVTGVTRASGEGVFGVFDVSDPVHPVQVSSLLEDGEEVILRDTLACVSWPSVGMKIINIADPGHPFKVGTVLCEACEAGVQGNYAYIAAWGLAVADITDPTGGLQVRYYNYFSDVVSSYIVASVVVSGSYAHVASDSGLLCVDVSGPWNPQLVGACPGRSSEFLDASSSYVYISDADSLRVVDVANQYRPTLVGGYSGPCAGVKVQDTVAYLASLGQDSIGLEVLSVADPRHPRQMGACRFPCDPGLSRLAGLALAPPYVYVAGDSNGVSGVFVVNAGDPGAPELRRFVRVDTGITLRLAVGQGYLYVAASQGGMLVMDLANPDRPVKAARYRDSVQACSITGIALSGSLAFAACSSAGLRILNVADPRHPALQGFYRGAGSFRDVCAVGDLGYACGGSSFAIFESGPPVGVGNDCSVLGEAAFMSVWPNPARGSVTIRYAVGRFGLAPHAPVIGLYDIAGKLVRRIDPGARSATGGPAGSFTLDTRFFARGVYVLRCRAEDQTLTRKLVIE